MRTRLYIASTDALTDPARFERLARTIPSARREKLDALRHDGARRLSLAASLLLILLARGQARDLCDLLRRHGLRLVGYGFVGFFLYTTLHLFSLWHTFIYITLNRLPLL